MQADLEKFVEERKMSSQKQIIGSVTEELNDVNMKLPKDQQMAAYIESEKNIFQSSVKYVHKKASKYDRGKINAPSDKIEKNTQTRQSPKFTQPSSEQLAKLKKEFENNMYPTEDRKKSLATEMGMSEAKVKHWFKNKRRKIMMSINQSAKQAQKLMDVNIAEDTQQSSQVTHSKTVFSSQQVARLKRELEDNRYVSIDKRKILADELGLQETQIKNWFHNRRKIMKKMTNLESDNGDKVDKPDKVGKLDMVGKPDMVGKHDKPVKSNKDDKKEKGGMLKMIARSYATKGSGRKMKKAKRELSERRAAESLSSTLGAILEAVKKHESAWPFLAPVDGKAVANYRDHIKYPMGENRTYCYQKIPRKDYYYIFRQIWQL